MIVGNGLLAKTFQEFKTDENIVIFASGVSNSLETDLAQFKRETDLVVKSLSQNSDKLFIYFSTCSIYDSSVIHRPYIQHKLAIENIIKENSDKYFIIRLSNIVGFGGNEATILNYLVNKVKIGEKFEIWKNATRNILDVEDALTLTKEVIATKKENRIVNIANLTSFKVLDIVKEVELFLNKKGTYVLKEKGMPITINVSEIEDIYFKVLSQDKITIDYISLLLAKYYS